MDDPTRETGTEKTTPPRRGPWLVAALDHLRNPGTASATLVSWAESEIRDKPSPLLTNETIVEIREEAFCRFRETAHDVPRDKLVAKMVTALDVSRRTLHLDVLRAYEEKGPGHPDVAAAYYEIRSWSLQQLSRFTGRALSSGAEDIVSSAITEYLALGPALERADLDAEYKKYLDRFKKRSRRLQGRMVPFDPTSLKQLRGRELDDRRAMLRQVMALVSGVEVEAVNSMTPRYYNILNKEWELGLPPRLTPGRSPARRTGEHDARKRARRQFFGRLEDMLVQKREEGQGDEFLMDTAICIVRERLLGDVIDFLKGIDDDEPT